MLKSLWLRVLILPFGLSHAVKGEISLPKIFGDHMVLQRDVPIRVWGKGAAGEKVAVIFGAEKGETIADEKGNWAVALKPVSASETAREFIVRGANEIRLADVLVGEVWLCSGQSNMEYAVAVPAGGAPPATKNDPVLSEEIANDSYPLIRLFRVQKKLQPPEVVSDGWTPCAGDDLARFSAVGFSFGRELQRALHMPVGLIQAAWGGSRIEPWTPASGYVGFPAFAKETEREPIVVDGYPAGKYFEGMIRPLAPFAIKGLIWYQGESNIIMTNDGLRYADKMDALVEAWRNLWAAPTLPVYSMQLAPHNYSARKDTLVHSVEELPKLWEAQERSLGIHDTYLVASTDFQDNLSNIHPGHKRELGIRLSLAVLEQTYGNSPDDYRAASFKTIRFAGERVIVDFKDAREGFVTIDGSPISGFEVAGSDQNYVPADAKAEQDRIIVSSPAVRLPVLIRYNWSEAAPSNLRKKNGLPVYPFRSDAPAWSPRPGGSRK